jgi:ribonucleoside-triphosphate reductase (thioredoxin)
VTLLPTGWPRTDAIMQRNRRIGASVTGVAQFLTANPLETLRQWLDDGYLHLKDYDRRLSRWLRVPESVKMTSIKPSGSVSLLGGATPGMHWPLSRTYIRRVSLDKQSPLLVPILNAGYTVEESKASPLTSCVVEMPVRIAEHVRTCEEVSMFEQLSLAAFLQRYWADNQVSCTVTFNPESEGRDIKPALEFYQYQLKGISFLPLLEKGAYAQMPYEAISDEVYYAKAAALKPVDWSAKALGDGIVVPWDTTTPEKAADEPTPASPPEERPDDSLLFCDGDQCTR